MIDWELEKIVADNKPLPPDEQRELIGKAQAGDQAARDRLILTSLRLVLSQVTKQMHDPSHWEDAFQEGVTGLGEAIDRFDLSRPVYFSTYATYWIRARVQEYTRSNVWRVFRIPDASPKQDSPQRERLLAERKDAAKQSVSLCSNHRDELSCDDEKTPDAIAARREEIGKMRLAMRCLDRRRRHVLLSRVEGGTLQEIGNELGVSKERVRQLEETALKQLASRLGSNRNIRSLGLRNVPVAVGA